MAVVQSDGEPEIERQAYHTAPKIVDPLRQQFAAQRVVRRGAFPPSRFIKRFP